MKRCRTAVERTDLLAGHVRMDATGRESPVGSGGRSVGRVPLTDDALGGSGSRGAQQVGRGGRVERL